MRSFFRDRGLGLAEVVLIMFAVSLCQASISYSVTFGALNSVLRSGTVTAAFLVLRFSLIAAMIVLWMAKRKHLLFRVIIGANAFFTAALLSQTKALVATLSGFASQAIGALMLNVVMMVVSNILIFSIWYWIIDPPGVEGVPRTDEPWDFLFPQRGGSLPHYESWVPRYADYLYLAFTTSFAFSPTDTLPLTRRAKMLMLLQSAISVVTLTGIAGAAINILAGSK
jgi:hypothetical protein